jgi:hypothetical protein
MGKYVNELMDEQVVILRKRRGNVQDISYCGTPVAIRVIALSDPARSEHDIPARRLKRSSATVHLETTRTIGEVRFLTVCCDGRQLELLSLQTEFGF